MPRYNRDLERPDDVPTLKLEHFNAEGNSADAVVYMPDEGLMVYDGKHYEIKIVIEDDYEIIDLFLDTYTDRNQKELTRLVLHYETLDNCRQELCYFVLEPNAEQKAKLTQVFHKYGAEMAEAAEKFKEAAAKIKTLAASLPSDVDAVCAGFDISHMYYRLSPNSYPINPDVIRGYSKWEKEATELLGKSTALSTAELFSRKRKAPE